MESLLHADEIVGLADLGSHLTEQLLAVVDVERLDRAGVKGRLVYEPPAADLIYEAHRLLEKAVLFQAQINGKKAFADMFGQMLHEARMFDLYVTDIKAFVSSTQRRVTCQCRVLLAQGHVKAVTPASLYDLLGIKEQSGRDSV